MIRPRLVAASRWASNLRTQRRWIFAKAVKQPLGRPRAKDDVKAIANANYPIIAELEATASDRAVMVNRSSFFRCDIVSPELCDDVLSYIGPTLEKHKNCDILDLNPGIGVWSSKIHEYLRPRTHVLLEPTPELYKNQLGSLLGTGSTYKLVQKSPEAFTTYEEIVKENILSHQKKYDRHDPRAVEQNNTLLITGTLAHHRLMPGFGNASIDRQLLRKLALDAWENRLFQVYGRVRVLVWLNNDDVRGFIAKSTTEKSPHTNLISKLYDVREVVAPEPAIRWIGNRTREFRYQLQSTARAVKSMRKYGLEIPAHRQSVLHKLGSEIINRGIEDGDLGNDGSLEFLEIAERNGISTAGLLKEVHRDRLAGEVALMKDPSIEREPETREKRPRGQNKRLLTEWGKRHGYNKTQTGIWIRDRKRRSELIDMAMVIYRLECQLMKSESEQEKQITQVKLDQLNLEYEEATGALIEDLWYEVNIDLDNHYALQSPTPILDWDQRLYNPLEMRNGEIWPATRLSLLDFNPRRLPQSATPLDGFSSYRAFVSRLTSRYTDSVIRGMEMVQPGASELLYNTPELHDPEKGGRLDMRHFRTRLLTVEMIDALYKAYMNWPFRGVKNVYDEELENVLMSGTTSKRGGGSN